MLRLTAEAASGKQYSNETHTPYKRLSIERSINSMLSGKGSSYIQVGWKTKVPAGTD